MGFCTVRVGRPFVISVLALLAGAHAASAQSEILDRQRVRVYLAIVAQCRSGRLNLAVPQALELPGLEATIAALTRLEPVIVSAATSSGDIEWRDVDAAILLHTATAGVAAQSLRPATADGHLRAAIALTNWRDRIDAARARQGEPPVAPAMNRRDWILGTIVMFTQVGERGRAAILADDAAKRFPRDAQIQLAAGAVDELRIHLDSGVSPRVLLSNAADRYRAALAAAPGLREAALRCGRVLALQGHYAEGALQLERVLSASPDVRIGYLARLFMGAELERRGQWTDATAQYGAAVSALPEAQAARTALAFALCHAGRADEARTIVDAGLLPGFPRGPLDDPFVAYKFGPMIDAQALFLGLFKSVAR